MLAIGYWSDKTKERKWFLVGTMVLASGGLAMAAVFGGSIWSILSLCVAAIGILGCKGPFWPLPSAYLSGTAIAGGIAFINSIGNLGGFAGPYMVGWMKETTGSYKGGLYALAGLAAAAVVVTIVFVRAGGPRSIAADDSLAALKRVG
jgi:ACS family tartrate transporter-like MFS transporter